jgi:hypothetical protein
MNRRRYPVAALALAALIMVALVLGLALAGCSGKTASGSSSDISVAAGQTHVVEKTTQVRSLTVAQGGTIKAPDGKSLTMTVDGMETGQALVTTAGVDTLIVSGTYKGDVVLTVTGQNPVAKTNDVVFPLRQALFFDSSGVVDGKSVLSAVGGQKPTTSTISGLKITSTGECFDGLYVAGGSYVFDKLTIDLTGNGRSDFVGYGAAVVSTGKDTKVVLDGATINNTGVVRAAVVATGGSNMVVKNSQIRTSNGTLPADYQPTTETSQMRSVPWMLGLSGNVRATNLLGDGTKASYINSDVSSEGWGVLSTDEGSNGQLTAIDSTVTISGQDGYGSYAIGNATERFLGTTFNVGTYATINRGGSVYYGDSDPAAIAQLNTDLGLGLTDAELKALPQKSTTVNSKRFGVMWHGSGSVDVSGGTVFTTNETTFLDKGQTVTVTVDGSKGAQLNPANGVIFQLMDNDDPGSTTGTFTVPTSAPTKNASWDVTSTSNAATASFANITLKGDLYNAMRGDATAGEGGAPSGGAPSGAGTPPSGAAPGGAPPSGGTPPSGGAGSSGGTPPGGGGSSAGGLNLVVTFDKSSITGVISASQAKYADGVTVIDQSNYRELGTVTNTAAAAVNNGVIVTLKDGSIWTVTGTSYLTSLTIGGDSSVAAPAGRTLSMTVDGAATQPTPGKSYTGVIVLTVG